MDENNRISNTENINDEVPADELAYENLSEETTSFKIEEDSKEKKSWQRELYEWVSSVAFAVVLAFIINTFFFSLVQVDGLSMVPTLNHGERLIVRKIAYTPDNGDIVIVNIASLQASTGGLYQYPVTVPKKGEIADINIVWAEYLTNPTEVFISEENGKTMVSGSSFVPDGEFIEGKTTYTQDGYFVMGDNRNGSSDSRSHGIIPEDEIVGKAVVRFAPLSQFGLIK